MANKRNAVIEPPGPWRVQLVLGCFGLFALVLAGRALYLQVLDQDFLASEGAKRHVRTLTVPAGRGAILDRRGEPLALSAPVESVWAVPGEVLANPGRIPQLAKLLGLSAKELRDGLEKRAERSFMYLRRQMTPAAAKRVKALGVPGVFLQREYRRFYPAAEAAAQLVGYTNIDNQGQEGIELALEQTLHGEAGSRRVIKDLAGRVVEDLAEFDTPQPGDDVHLSIDLRVQYLAYRELKAMIEAENADGGVMVVVNPATGEVLALASYPSFNPNRREGADMDGHRQRAAVDTFEPGSTVKPIVVAAGMEAGLFNRNSIIPTHGTWPVGRLLVRDFRNYGDMDLGRLLMKSSNVGAAKIGMTLGAERLYNTYRNFGFGELSGINFPGESSGVLRDHYSWGDIATATSSYGYSMSVTGLQLVRSYLPLATDGYMRPLSILKLDEPPEAEQVISANTARQIREYLKAVVTPVGTARRAAIEGYVVAGKTGTVRKVGVGGYKHKRHQSMFVGMVPADEPRLLAMVMVDEPRGKEYYGGAVAAPVFREVIKDSLRMLQIPPQQLPDAVTASAPQGPRS
ncbi:MAG: penicillin-binding protein 2 [Salinisphaeraceae bacterium]|nr:penicillin-binding protein 2 [Salinisphaeraceae bacterium]